MVDPELLPQVRIADCNCITGADILLIGYRYKFRCLLQQCVGESSSSAHPHRKEHAEMREPLGGQCSPGVLSLTFP